MNETHILEHRYTIAAKAVLIFSVAVYMAGCAMPEQRTVDRVIARPGIDAVNVINVRGNHDEAEVITYSRTHGERSVVLSPDQVVVLASKSGKWGDFEIIAPSDQVGMNIHQFIGLDLDIDFISAADTAIEQTLQGLPSVSSFGLRLQIVAAVLTDTGYSIQQRSLRSEPSLTLSFIVPVEVEGTGKERAGHWWASVVSTVGHELLHLEHYLTDLGMGLLDWETAAHLMGECAEARFAQAIEVEEALNHIVLDRRLFPGIEYGEFAPDMPTVRKLGPAGIQGKAMALAVLYHLYYEDNESIDQPVPEATKRRSIDLADPEVTGPMLEMCDSLAYKVPEFSRGQLPGGNEL